MIPVWLWITERKSMIWTSQTNQVNALPPMIPCGYSSLEMALLKGFILSEFIWSVHPDVLFQDFEQSQRLWNHKTIIIPQSLHM
jgi:hypothetical protein